METVIIQNIVDSLKEVNYQLNNHECFYAIEFSDFDNSWLEQEEIINILNNIAKAVNRIPIYGYPMDYKILVDFKNATFELKNSSLVITEDNYEYALEVYNSLSKHLKCKMCVKTVYLKR